MDVRIVFDGGSLGNPGRGYGSYRVSDAAGAWSAPVRLDFGPAVTSNEAEYRALLAALDAVARDHADPREVGVEVLGDSRLVLNQLAGRWKVRADNLRPLHDAARQAAARFRVVRYTWHPRSRSVHLLGH